MKHSKLPVPPLPDHSPSLRPEANLSAHEESALAIANLFRDLGASAIASGLFCKGARSGEELRETAEYGIERVEALIKEIEELTGEKK